MGDELREDEFGDLVIWLFGHLAWVKAQSRTRVDEGFHVGEVFLERPGARNVVSFAASSQSVKEMRVYTLRTEGAATQPSRDQAHLGDADHGRRASGLQRSKVVTPRFQSIKE